MLTLTLWYRSAGLHVHYKLSKQIPLPHHPHYRYLVDLIALDSWGFLPSQNLFAIAEGTRQSNDQHGRPIGNWGVCGCCVWAGWRTILLPCLTRTRWWFRLLKGVIPLVFSKLPKFRKSWISTFSHLSDVLLRLDS